MQDNYFSVEEEKMISEEECFETDNEKTIEGDNCEPSVEENAIKSDVFDVIKKHFDKFWLYYALPVIICALFFAVLKASNIYPFSHDCISSYDLLAQICPFLEHFYDVFDGDNGRRGRFRNACILRDKSFYVCFFIVRQGQRLLCGKLCHAAQTQLYRALVDVFFA